MDLSKTGATENSGDASSDSEVAQFYRPGLCRCVILRTTVTLASSSCVVLIYNRHRPLHSSILLAKLPSLSLSVGAFGKCIHADVATDKSAARELVVSLPWLVR